MGIINVSAPGVGGFLVRIISGLITGCGSIAVGIILFTVILKLITLPFDFMSRVSMRKNSLKMEEMRPELEKLQKQYADNKELYNQKMMALYKKNGYSMFGACLPTILTLVIFIVALRGFTAYSQWQNREYLYNMSVSYNSVVYSGIDVDGTYIKENSDGSISIDYEKLLNTNEVSIKDENNVELYKIYAQQEEKKDILDDTNTIVGKKINLMVFTDNSYVKYVIDCDVYDNGEIKGFSPRYLVRYEGLVSGKLAKAENNNLQLLGDNGESKKDFATYYTENFEGVYEKIVETERAVYVAGKLEGVEEDKESVTATANAEFDAKLLDATYVAKLTATANEKISSNFILDIQQEKSAETYREEEEGFLWIKNIWVTDSPMKHPVETSWSTFKKTHEYKGFDIGDPGYATLTAKLGAEKEQANGYFILVILTAGVSLAMQLVTNKSQKAQMELQTVDGQGAQTQKIMKWMMPIMMAIFAFMYTSAFSIYIILSSLISMGTTVGINFIVDRRFKKQKEKGDDGKTRKRIYTPKEEEKQDPKKAKKVKEDKDDKFAHESGGDFLTGKKKVKKAKPQQHIRGRLK